MIHPDLHNWQTAKKAALAIAANMHAEVIQTPDGKTKRVIIGKKIVDCTSWYAAYCYLHRIRLDQIGTKTQEPPQPAAKAIPPPKTPLPPMAMAIILPDLPTPPKGKIIPVGRLEPPRTPKS